MDGVFESRKESFINSLEKSILTISSDEYIRQMFQDGYSAAYVPDRICELIRQILVSDREEEINRLYNKIYALEFFFDEEKIRQIENLGNKYITASSSQNSKNNWNSQHNSTFNNFTFGFSDYDGHSMRNSNTSNQSQNIGKTKKEDIILFGKILIQQIKSLGIKNIPIERNDQIPIIFNDLKKSIKNFEKTMYSVQNDFSALMRRTKKQALKVYQLSTEKVKQECVQKVQKAKYYINKQNEQIQQLSNSLNDTQTLEENVQQLKEKLFQSKRAVANLQEEISSQKNENAELNDKINNLSLENRQLTEEHNRLNNFLNEKQQRIEYLEKSMSKIESEILEQEQVEKIQQKVLNLNDTIRKIQYENETLQKKSDSNDKIISDLIQLTNSTQASDLVTKVDRLCQEKAKICQILNRPVHSDDSKIISDIQKLNDQKRTLKKFSEKVDEIKDVQRILNAQDENDMKTKVVGLQRLKNAFDKLCLDCGIEFDNDTNSLSYNLPETVVSLQKSYQTVKDLMDILNLNSQDRLKDILTNLVDSRENTLRICEIFRIKSDNESQLIPASKLVKIAQNLVKVKTSYDTIVSSLNSSIVSFNKNDSFLLLDFESFDEEKAKKARMNARSFIFMKSNLKSLCEVLKIDFKLPVNKVLSTLLKRVKTVAKSHNNYQKVLDLLHIKEIENDDNGILTYEKVAQSIHSLLQNTGKTSNNNKGKSKDVENSKKTSNKSLLDVSNEVREIWFIVRDLCSIFKVEEPDFHSSSSLSMTHKSLCLVAKSLQESQSMNLSSVYNIAIRLKHFKQGLNSLKRNDNKLRLDRETVDEKVDEDLRKIEDEIIQIMNDLSNIFICFGTSDYNEIKLAKLNFELQKKEVQRLSQITGKESFEESLDFLSKHFISIKQSSSFLGRLFRILLLIPKNSFADSSSSSILPANDGIPLPIPRAVQEKLLSLASQQNIEKVQLKNVVDKIINKARSLGFSVSNNKKLGGFGSELNELTVTLEPDNNEIFYSVESALKFIVDNAKKEVEAKYAPKRKSFEDI